VGLTVPLAGIPLFFGPPARSALVETHPAFRPRFPSCLLLAPAPLPFPRLGGFDSLTAFRDPVFPFLLMKFGFQVDAWTFF